MFQCRVCSCLKVLSYIIIVAGLIGLTFTLFFTSNIADYFNNAKPAVVTAVQPVQPLLQPEIQPPPPIPQVAAPVTPPAPSPTVNGEYKVQKGDTLWDLSKKFYGDPTQYMKIFEANEKILWDPDRIYVGQTLKIPNR